jgi:uncharacterized protein YoxC
MEFDITIKIFAIIAIIAFIILAVFIIISLKSVVNLIKGTEQSLNKITYDISELKDRFVQTLGEFSEIKVQVIKSLEQIEEIKDKTIESMTNANQAITEINSTVNSLESHFNAAFDFVKPLSILSNYVYDKVALPVMNVANLVAASSKAITTFTKLLSRKK